MMRTSPSALKQSRWIGLASTRSVSTTHTALCGPWPESSTSLRLPVRPKVNLGAMAVSLDDYDKDQMLLGENLESGVENNVTRFTIENESQLGYCYVTNYALCFRCTRIVQEQKKGSSKGTIPETPKLLRIPIGMISHQEKLGGKKMPGGQYSIMVTCKDLRIEHFHFERTSNSRSLIFEKVSEFLSPSDFTKLFCFQHFAWIVRERSRATRSTVSPVSNNPNNGWKLYDPFSDYGRMGVTEHCGNGTGWRISSINREFSVCDTYPRYICVPERMLEQELHVCATYRTRGRLPCMVWRNLENGAALCRSSQPKMGLRMRESKLDKKLLDEITRPGTDMEPTGDLVITDCRPMINAAANLAKGGGFEKDVVEKGNLHFLDIHNIHSMRDSFMTLMEDLHNSAKINSGIAPRGGVDSSTLHNKNNPHDSSAATVVHRVDRTFDGAVAGSSSQPIPIDTQLSSIGQQSSTSSLTSTVTTTTNDIAGSFSSNISFVDVDLPDGSPQKDIGRLVSVSTNSLKAAGGMINQTPAVPPQDSSSAGVSVDEEGAVSLPNSDIAPFNDPRIVDNVNLSPFKGRPFAVGITSLVLPEVDETERASVSASPGRNASSPRGRGRFTMNPFGKSNKGKISGTANDGGVADVPTSRSGKNKSSNAQKAFSKGIPKESSDVASSSKKWGIMPGLGLSGAGTAFTGLGVWHRSKWLDHVRMTLAGAAFVASVISKGKNVLVHCSDGWDRTPQVTSLAQLMLDPHYRTIRGFCCLIEKEWCSFGHKFKDRCCLGYPVDDQYSPIFLQFMDCTFQLTSQFPYAFEFGEAFLIHILDQAYSNRYGTFLFNSFKQRQEIELDLRSESLWTSILSNKAQWVQPLFKKDQTTVLVPNVHTVVFWSGYLCRHYPSVLGDGDDSGSHTYYTRMQLLEHELLKTQQERDALLAVFASEDDSTTKVAFNTCVNEHGDTIAEVGRKRSGGFSSQNHVGSVKELREANERLRLLGKRQEQKIGELSRENAALKLRLAELDILDENNGQVVGHESVDRHDEGVD